MSIVYPKPLPIYELATEYDETHLSVQEKRALKQGLHVINQRFRWHSMQLYVEFLSINEYAINNFRDGNEKLRLFLMTSHSNFVLNFYEKIIKVGIYDKALLYTLMFKLVKRHSKSGVGYDIIKTFIDFTSKHIHDDLCVKKSATLINAFDKLNRLILDFHLPRKRVSVAKRLLGYVVDADLDEDEANSTVKSERRLTLIDILEEVEATNDA